MFSEFLHTIKSFKDMINEKAKDPNYGLGNDHKGKLHEILVGHFLKHGVNHDHPDNWKPSSAGQSKFPERPPAPEGSKKEKPSKAVADTAEGLHDHIRSSISDENYGHHVRIAHFAASKIIEGLAEEGHISRSNKGNSRITNVHWTSRPGDIERLSGEADKANTADIMVKKTKKKKPESGLVVETNNGPAGGGEHIGISLKIHNEKKESTLANPGRGTLDVHHHVNTDAHENAAIEAAHNAAAHYGINTRNIPKRKAHDLIKNDKRIKNTYKPVADKQLYAITDAYRNSMKGKNPHRLANIIRRGANIKPTKIKLYKSATYGTDNLSHSFANPLVEMDSILKEHEGHVAVAPGKNTTTINFTGKVDPKTNKPTPIGKLTVKYGSGTPHSGVVGAFQGWSATAKNNVSKESKAWAKQKHGYNT